MGSAFQGERNTSVWGPSCLLASLTLLAVTGGVIMMEMVGAGEKVNYLPSPALERNER